MNMTVGQLFTVQNGLESIANNKTSATIAYKILKIRDVIAKELSIIEAARLELVNKYALKDQDGKPIIEDNRYQFPDEAIHTTFQKEYNDLLKADVQVNCPKLTLFELDSLGSISVAALASLEPVVQSQEVTCDCKECKE